ncbi:MAG TPA: MFS transporter [Myxococcota bacterium]|jgi:predicted MFS family arabinose efflux permease|nr:MFS transporter [Myxococcota bacterium]
MADSGPTRGVTRAISLAVLVAALGYFVDIYDLILFSVVRVKSLKALGVPEPLLLDKGLLLLNMQMSGMLLGGILWGVLGDKRGRLSVLFGSILLYSVANIANGLVTTVAAYAALRFLAGVGLAGELGAGITLVSESMSKEHRGYGTMIVATIGILGAVVAVFVGETFNWRVAYFVGGGLGLGLLVLRVGVIESGMFQHLKSKAQHVERGNFFKLFVPLARARRYVAVILIGVPIWFVVGILVTLSKEFGEAMHMTVVPTPARAVLFSYVGLAIGDFGSGWLSQRFRSRRRIVGAFLVLTALFVAAYFVVGARSLGVFYAVCLALGVSTGYWAVFVTIASEQFGTNLRATATTTAPNFVRGAVVLLTSAFQLAKAPLGVVGSGIAVGAVTLLVAFVALAGLEETYGKDLDFLEP